MSNPFDNENLVFIVLTNSENQHSLWPEFINVPTGWHIQFGPSSRAECISYINENWQDLRPKSLQEQMKNKLN